jgi:hypothetical protein
MIFHNALQIAEKAREDLARFSGHAVLADPYVRQLEDICRILRLSAGEHSVADPWISLPSAMVQTGLSDSFFRAPLRLLGGKSRLQSWQEGGLAKQEGRQWFLARSIELPVRAGKGTEVPRQTDGAVHSEADRLYTDMQRARRRVG